jgi:hypothetical protein
MSPDRAVISTHSAAYINNSVSSTSSGNGSKANVAPILSPLPQKTPDELKRSADREQIQFQRMQRMQMLTEHDRSSSSLREADSSDSLLRKAKNILYNLNLADKVKPFKQAFPEVLKQHAYVEIPFGQLKPKHQAMALQMLADHPEYIGHLNEITLDFTGASEIDAALVVNAIRAINTHGKKDLRFTVKLNGYAEKRDLEESFDAARSRLESILEVALSPESKVTCVNLSNNASLNISSDTRIGKLLKGSSLPKLIFRHSCCNNHEEKDKDKGRLSSLLEVLPPAMKKLDLEDNGIGSDISYITALLLGSGLEKIYLRNNKFRFDEAVMIADVLPHCKNLRLLDLSSNAIPDGHYKRGPSGLSWNSPKLVKDYDHKRDGHLLIEKAREQAPQIDVILTGNAPQEQRSD